jgi:hypothetical protein
LGLAAHFHFLHVVSIDYCFCDLIHALGYQKRLYRMLGDSLSNFYLNWLLMMNLSSNNIRLHNSISFLFIEASLKIVSMFAFSLCGMDLPLNLLPECQLLDCQEQQGRKQ